MNTLSMDKILLLLRIKVKCLCLSLLLNKILILATAKKTSELSFYSRLKMYVLMVSTLALAFKIIKPIIFSTVRKVSFPQSKKFSLVKEFFHSQGNFPQTSKFSTKLFFLPHTKKFSTDQVFFLDQGSFLQTKIFTQPKKLCGRNKKVFQKPKFQIHSILNLLQKYFQPFNACW